MSQATLRLVAAACCGCACPIQATVAQTPPVETEADEIAANLERTDPSEAAKGFEWLEDFARSRREWRGRAGLDLGVTYHMRTNRFLRPRPIPTTTRLGQNEPGTSIPPTSPSTFPLSDGLEEP